jgi:hypothetical protein
LLIYYNPLNNEVNYNISIKFMFSYYGVCRRVIRPE